MDSTRKLPLNIDTDTEDEEPILVANVHRTVKIGPNGTRMIEIVETNDRGKTRSVRRNLQIPAGKGRGISGAEQTALAEEQAYELFLQDRYNWSSSLGVEYKIRTWEHLIFSVHLTSTTD
ncbi:unnamed protein product [Hermetia illucens]|uniref:Uncharacterized protein n=1 Tax=Hermetia illucens TaxID=343691 RepID=A0A7R8UL08_HERIL|nr:unnamed protein product [Hermetia illucens]